MASALWITLVPSPLLDSLVNRRTSQLPQRESKLPWRKLDSKLTDHGRTVSQKKHPLHHSFQCCESHVTATKQSRKRIGSYSPAVFNKELKLVAVSRHHKYCHLGNCQKSQNPSLILSKALIGTIQIRKHIIEIRSNITTIFII